MFCIRTMAQDLSDLPLVLFNAPAANMGKTLVVYISGDGGDNSFSKDFCKQWSNKGSDVILFNSRKYFWSKKTPEKTAADVERIIRHYRQIKKRDKILLIGYSFGADVLPFVVTRLPTELSASINNIVLMSPAKINDFEVHLSGLLGVTPKNGFGVVDEINRMKGTPVLIVQGINEEDRISAAAIKIPKHKFLMIEGGHRYESMTGNLVDHILQNL